MLKIISIFLGFITRRLNYKLLSWHTLTSQAVISHCLAYRFKMLATFITFLSFFVTFGTAHIFAKTLSLDKFLNFVNFVKR